MNTKINPVLYKIYLRLHQTLCAEMVHRRRRTSSNCIEIVFYDEHYIDHKRRVNTLKEAEKSGYSVIFRPQTKHGHETWHGKAVFQLFLAPVHPKKRREARLAAEQKQRENQLAQQVSFGPIYNKNEHPCTKKTAHTCIYAKKVVILRAK